MAESAGSNGAFARVITGGNAISLIAHLEHDYQLEPNLIFHGLQAIADHPTRRLSENSDCSEGQCD